MPLIIRTLPCQVGYYARLQRLIEGAVAQNGEPCIIVAHSMGGLVGHYFLTNVRLWYCLAVFICTCHGTAIRSSCIFRLARAVPKLDPVLCNAMQVVSQIWRQRYLHAFVAMGTPW